MVVVVHVLDVRCVVLEMLEVSMSAMQRCDAVKTMELRLFCKKKYEKISILYDGKYSCLCNNQKSVISLF